VILVRNSVNNNRNILLIGLGSIGKRHFKNLLSLGYNNITVVTSKTSLPHDLSIAKVFSSTKAALGNNHYAAAFICTPTAAHTKDLLLLLQNKVENIYVEKPLSHSLNRLDEVFKLAAFYSPNIFIGYDLRFHPALQKVKELIDQNAIGKVISANAFVGQHLPQWRPYEDYRKGMSAKKETGGGVMLDLIHEVDYLYWLFGNAASVTCNYVNTGELEIETEEAAEMLLKFSNGTLATVHLDYWQPQIKRYCYFTGTKGTIYWDYCASRVTITNMQNEQQNFCFENVERNDRFIEIIKTFLQHSGDERLTSINEGLDSLKIILAAKQAAENNSVVKLAEFIHHLPLTTHN
jgi:predicted dehydrogenase